MISSNNYDVLSGNWKFKMPNKNHVIRKTKCGVISMKHCNQQKNNVENLKDPSSLAAILQDRGDKLYN